MIIKITIIIIATIIIIIQKKGYTRNTLFLSSKKVAWIGGV